MVLTLILLSYLMRFKSASSTTLLLTSVIFCKNGLPKIVKILEQEMFTSRGDLVVNCSLKSLWLYSAVFPSQFQFQFMANIDTIVQNRVGLLDY